MDTRIIKLDKTKLVYSYSFSKEAHSTLLFLPGFMSNRKGTKALFLERLSQKLGMNYLCPDYRGHGESEGSFKELTLSDWLEDCRAIASLSQVPLSVIGSSMGGWLALLLAQKSAENIQKLILLAPAPDFTERLLEEFDAHQKKRLEVDGFISLDRGYDQPHIFTRNLIEDGKNHLLLGKELPLQCPVSIIQGKKDDSVPWKTALKLGEILCAPRVSLYLQDYSDHSLTRLEDFELLESLI